MDKFFRTRSSRYFPPFFLLVVLQELHCGKKALLAVSLRRRYRRGARRASPDLARPFRLIF